MTSVVRLASLCLLAGGASVSPDSSDLASGQLWGSEPGSSASQSWQLHAQSNEPTFQRDGLGTQSWHAPPHSTGPTSEVSSRSTSERYHTRSKVAADPFAIGANPFPFATGSFPVATDPFPVEAHPLLLLERSLLLGGTAPQAPV